jgi:hypothetical protein
MTYLFWGGIDGRMLARDYEIMEGNYLLILFNLFLFHLCQGRFSPEDIVMICRGRAMEEQGMFL